MRSTMHNHRTSRFASIALVGALSAVALSGCGGGGEDEGSETTTVTETAEASPEESAEEPTEEEPSPEESEPTDEPTESEPTAEPSPEESDASAQPSGEPSGGTDDPPAEGGDVPPPGTEVAVGDTITTHVQALEEGDEYYGLATLATTVVSVEEGDPSLFTQAENAADFEGMVPWFVQSEHEWLTYEGEPNSNMIPNLIAFNESGGELGPVINSTWSEGIPGCTVDIPTEKGVGQTASDCTVFAVPEGEAIGSVGWVGDDMIDGGGSASDNPYWDEPVLWNVQ